MTVLFSLVFLIPHFIILCSAFPTHLKAHSRYRDVIIRQSNPVNTTLLPQSFNQTAANITLNDPQFNDNQPSASSTVQLNQTVENITSIGSQVNNPQSSASSMLQFNQTIGNVTSIGSQVNNTQSSASSTVQLNQTIGNVTSIGSQVNYTQSSASNTLQINQTIVNVTSIGPQVNDTQPSTSDMLQISIANNLQDGSNVNVYITGNDPDGRLAILQPNWQWYYPPQNISTAVPTVIPANLITIPLQSAGQATNITLPTYISAGRIWFAQGELRFSVVQTASGTALVEPAVTGSSQNGTSWGFVELTYTSVAGLWTNISYVDFVGMILGMFLTSSTSPIQSTPGLQKDAVLHICNGLANQTAVDGYPWHDLCVEDSQGQPLRVLSPGDYVQVHPDAFSDYWASYVDQVWSTYSSQTLTINTQSGELGDISCIVNNDALTCGGNSSANATFTKPSAADIFGCSSGPFAIDSSANDLQKAVVPRLCAAFNRSTFLLNGGNVQPNGLASSSYYTSSETTNWYSKLVHQWETKGRGYAFAYDDVTPDSELTGDQSQSGELISASPNVLTVMIGGSS